MPDQPPVIAVDGPSGSGKGLVATHLARQYRFNLLDSGALYRLVGLAARNEGIILESGVPAPGALDIERLAAISRNLDVTFVPTGDPEDPLEIKLSGVAVTRKIRSDEAGVDASIVASIQPVRVGLHQRQVSFRQPPGLVADGRDMGTEVFPDAIVKIFLTASPEARAARRYNQLKDKGIGVSLHDLFKSIQARDERDTERSVSPLRPAEDAFVIDSTDMDVATVLDLVRHIVAEKLGD
ncbi:MAG: cytidylate kinase [Candidatus Azotimanducaceae bacterium]|jgi:cytidylate kinase